jgi:hypothetical protein
VVILELGEGDDLELGENNDLWLNNTEVLYGTILGDSHQNISEKEPVATYLVLNNYEKLPPLLLY